MADLLMFCKRDLKISEDKATFLKSQTIPFT